MAGFIVYRLGEVEYDKALVIQKQLLNLRIKGEIEDSLILLQHPPTLTTGRRGSTQNLLITPEKLKEHGIGFQTVSRGGDITFHGPGQVVCYPIVDLKSVKQDAKRYVWLIEELIIEVLREFDIDAGRIEGLIGVWKGLEKIASIGVGIRKWVTYHGFALNVNNDLSYFDLIVPCGINGVRMTSMRELLGKKDVDIEAVENQIVETFSKLFNRELNAEFYEIDEKIFLRDSNDTEFRQRSYNTERLNR